MERKSALKIEDWQKHLLDERLADYYQNPTEVSDFDQVIDDIKKSLLCDE